MRKLFLLIIVFASLFACNNEKPASTETAAAKEEPKKEEASLPMPYEASYSSKFAIGDQKNALAVLTLFKQWDDNKLKESMGGFADSVSFYTNEWEFHGTKEKFYEESQKQRDMATEVKTVVHGWIPVKSTDHNEDWVLVWSTGYTKDKAGKMDSLAYQDTWRINKEGKVDLVYQHIAHAPKPAKK